MDQNELKDLKENVIDFLAFKRSVEQKTNLEVLSASFTGDDHIELHIRDSEGVRVVILTRTQAQDHAVRWLARTWTLEEYVDAVIDGRIP